MNARRQRARRTSASALAGAADALVELMNAYLTAMTEDERGSWLIGGMQVNVRLTVWSVHCEHRYESTSAIQR